MNKDKLIQCLKDRCGMVKYKLTDSHNSGYDEIDFIKETVIVSWDNPDPMNAQCVEDLMPTQKYTFEEILKVLNKGVK